MPVRARPRPEGRIWRAQGAHAKSVEALPATHCDPAAPQLTFNSLFSVFFYQLRSQQAELAMGQCRLVAWVDQVDQGELGEQGASV